MYRALLVDDEPLMRDALSTLVPWEAAGFEITGFACDGEEALAMLLEHPEIDVVFTDLKMPVMDGLTLKKRRRKKTSMPFLWCSAPMTNLIWCVLPFSLARANTC